MDVVLVTEAAAMLQASLTRAGPPEGRMGVRAAEDIACGQTGSQRRKQICTEASTCGPFLLKFPSVSLPPASEGGSEEERDWEC